MESEKPCSLLGENRVTPGAVRKPSSVFHRLIERFWFSDKKTKENGLFEILPDGNFDLVFILNDSRCTLLFAGPYTRKAAITILPGREYFGVPSALGKCHSWRTSTPVNSSTRQSNCPKFLEWTPTHWANASSALMEWMPNRHSSNMFS